MTIADGVFEVGDFVQGGSYPEAIWRVIHVMQRSYGQGIMLEEFYAPPGYWIPQSPTCVVPAYDFQPANGMLVIACASRR